MDKKRSALGVVAIDFGTSNSGYAYSFKSEYEKDHSAIYTNNWKSEDGLVKAKTPTVILFNQQKEFSKFWHEAETRYNYLQEEGKEDGWRFFRTFKMKLFREDVNSLQRTRVNRINELLEIRDEQGRTMPALVVFAESIRYLKDHFLKSSQIRGFKLEPNDVHFVLTVPAIWDDRAKQFMRKSAAMAGIPDHMLTLAYEPEAAALYCKELTVQKKNEGKASTLSTFETGKQFMVVDCGGGTVDITSYQIESGSHLKELYEPTGGPWGGTCVDNQYMIFLQNLFGRNTWEVYAKECPEDILEIQRRFEVKKKNIEFSSDDQTTIPYPVSFLTKYKTAMQCKYVEDGLKKSKYSDSIQVKQEKLRYDHRLVKEFFKQPVESIASHVKFLLKGTRLCKQNVNTMLLVGGFSDSSILSEHIIAEFKDLTVICPPDAVSAIMKGAVIFGHNPDLISERIAHRTYGISVNREFDPKIHPKECRVEYDGRVVCTDIFLPIVQIGQPIIVGKDVFKCKCLPAHAYDTTATVEIYESKNECPKYTIDKDVRRLGELTILIPNTSQGKNRPIEIQISFGYTEIKVYAFEEGTENAAEATFQCLHS